MKKIILWIFVSLLIILSIYAAPLTVKGDCSSKCFLNSSRYRVTLAEGEIMNFTYFNISQINWGWNNAATPRGLGRIYRAAFVLGMEITTTSCININQSSRVLVYCNNTNAANNWTFYDDYIMLESVGISGTYRVYDYINGSETTKDCLLWNGTKFNYQFSSAEQSFTDWHSNIGVFAYSYNRSFRNATLIHIWDETVTTDFDYLKNSITGSEKYQSFAIARNSEIAANTKLRQYIRVYATNSTKVDPERVTDIINCFKADPSSECATAAAPPPADSCTYSSGNWNIDCSDNCVFSSSSIISGNIKITGTGRLKLTNLWQFSGANRFIYINQGCQLDINSGGEIN